MSATTTCENPMCSCDPCGCTDCRCGVARLGDLERRVMEILWSRSDTELRVRDVADVLPEYAYTTVATVLDRLVHKGVVHRRRDGRTVLFTSVGTPGAHTAVLMHEALAVDRDTDAALLRFAETLSPPEAVVLRRALNALERNARKAER